MNFQIEVYQDNRRIRSGVWSASNIHTALARAASGYPMEFVRRNVSRTGKPKDWLKLGIGETMSFRITRI